MMNVLRPFSLRHAMTRRSTRKAPAKSVLSGVERLESRCMLSVAPSELGSSFGLHATAIRLIEPAGVDFVVSLDVASAAGQLQSSVTSSNAGPRSSSGHVTHSVDVGDHLPGEIAFSNAFRDVSAFLYEPGGSGAMGNTWLDAPQQMPVPSLTTPYPPQASSAPNDFINIGVVYEPISGGLFADDNPNQHRQDVLQMLSALKYLPEDLHDEAISSMYRVNDNGFTRNPLTDARSVSEPQSAGHQPNDAANESPPRESTEGGMVALSRETVIDDAISAENAPALDVDLLFSVPVQMDSAYGRFQAFEISTAEDASHSATSAPARRPPIPSPDSDAGALAPLQKSNPLPKYEMSAESSLVSFQPMKNSGANDSQAAAIVRSLSVSSETMEMYGGTETPPIARAFREEDAKASWLLTATVAAIACVSGALAVRPAFTHKRHDWVVTARPLRHLVIDSSPPGP